MGFPGCSVVLDCTRDRNRIQCHTLSFILENLCFPKHTFPAIQLWVGRGVRVRAVRVRGGRREPPPVFAHTPAPCLVLCLLGARMPCRAHPTQVSSVLETKTQETGVAERMRQGCIFISFISCPCSLFLIMLLLLSEIEYRILKGHCLLRAGSMRMTGSV